MIKVPLFARDRIIVAHALIDEEDEALVFYHRWLLGRGGYAYRHMTDRGRGNGWTSMHRFVLGLCGSEDGMVVDHIDRNKLNNTRSNLRLVTPTQNCQNLPTKPHASKYRGVTWNKRAARWQAAVKVSGKNYYLGLYADEDAAGNAAREFRHLHMPYAVEAA